jgi:hypothetical protein
VPGSGSERQAAHCAYGKFRWSRATIFTRKEDAARAMNRINLRTRVERQKLRDENRAKPSMPKEDK